VGLKKQRDLVATLKTEERMKDTQQMLQTEREKLNHDTDISLVKNTREDWIILEKKQVLFYI